MEFYEGLTGTAFVLLLFGIAAGIAARWPHPRAKEVMAAMERNKLNKNTETLGAMAFFLLFLSLLMFLFGIWVGVASS